MMKYTRIWAKALGEKAGNNDREADLIASVRTAIVLIYIITNFVIVAGVIRHWNDLPKSFQYQNEKGIK